MSSRIYVTRRNVLVEMSERFIHLKCPITGETTDMLNDRAIVRAVGDMVTSVTVGDDVIIDQTKIKWVKDNLFIVHEIKILAVVRSK